jgi:hypothetical protein
VCKLCGEASNGTYVCSRCEPPSFLPDSGDPEAGQESAGGAAAADTASAWQRQRKSPGLAACLAVCFPSLGHLYVGQYIRAFVLIAIFVGLIQLTDVADIMGLFIAFFYFFQIFDAHRLATNVNLSVVSGSREPTTPPPPPTSGAREEETAEDSAQAEDTARVAGFQHPRDEQAEPDDHARRKAAGRSRDHRMGGWILITIGALFLLHNMGFSLFHIGRMWPVILIVIGLRLLWKYLDARPGSNG